MSIRKVLLVADDPLVRTSLENCLGGHPYSLYVCATIADAQPLLIRGEVDIVFIDARLPDPATTNLLDFIHSLPDCPITIVTIGYANLDFAIECVKNGAFDYTIKPFSE